MKNLPMTVLLASTIALGQSKFQPLNVKTGLWESTTTSTTAGEMPLPSDMLAKFSPDQRARIEARMNANSAARMGTFTNKQCETKEKLAEQPFSSQKECKSSIITSTATKAEIKMSCDYGSPERLVPVLNHNQMDLRGLAALSNRLLSLLNDAEDPGQDGLELFGVSRICEKRGEHTRARNLYERSIGSILPAETDRKARRSLARLAKREGDFELPCELWKDALGNSRHGYDAHEQLAIYYEHWA